MRRPANAIASADAASSQWASSTSASTGCSSAAAQSRLKAPTSTASRSTGWVGPMASALLSASAWRPGRFGARRASGVRRSTSPTNGTDASVSTPRARTTHMSSALAAACSRSDVLPIPGSPETTSAPPLPLRASSSSRSIRRHSSPLPTSMRPSVPIVASAGNGFQANPRGTASGGATVAPPLPSCDASRATTRCRGRPSRRACARSHSPGLGDQGGPACATHSGGRPSWPAPGGSRRGSCRRSRPGR